MKIILFEDNQVDKLYPITSTRAAFDILCGGLSLYDALRREFKDVAIDFFVRDQLQEVAKNKFSLFNAGSKEVLFVNAVLVPDLETIQQLKIKVDQQQDFVWQKDGQVVAAFATNLEIYIEFSRQYLLTFVKDLPTTPQDFVGRIFTNVWDPIIYNQEIIKSNLEILAQDYQAHEVKGLFIGNNVKIEDQVVFDATDGPIILADDVTVKSASVLRGPLFVGSQTIINSFSEIKDGSCLGRVCKVGGEVEAAIIQDYTNKQHYGFLGHAYVGSWVNLGAGTTNSDIKNTYGEIRMQGLSTGRQFLGCVIADHVKAGIGTMIFTGKVIGVASLLYGSIVADVPAFSNFGTGLKKAVTADLAVAKKIQQAVFKRRGVEQTAADLALLDTIFVQTAADRKKLRIKSGQPELR
ncbi:MAG: putative sugar nucleotidyl transferase [Patescibacteria group bacterium]|jgi:glucose-1-phosphate thymidylyltransferase|nr:putative sugar nucleotidyl transferase [Patescibacteria group bacterium]